MVITFVMSNRRHHAGSVTEDRESLLQPAAFECSEFLHKRSQHAHTHTQKWQADRIQQVTWVWHLSKAAADISMQNSEVIDRKKWPGCMTREIAKV